MAALNFSAAVDDWAKETQDRLERIWKESTQRVHAEIVDNLSGGVVNVQTGFLRASDRASTESMPPIESGARPKEGASYPHDFGQITAVISGAHIPQTIWVGWVAEYGPYLEFGTSKIAPRGFVRLAVAQWDTIVSQVVAEAKSRAA